MSPQILSAEVVTLRERRASVVYTANQCVATRFSLAGSDGTAKQGRSRGFDPDVFCDTAWRLDFTGRDGLKPDTSYVLSIWIKGASGEVASSQLSFTTPD